MVMPEQSFQQPQLQTPNKNINNNNNSHKQHEHGDSSNGGANQRPDDKQKEDKQQRHPPPGLRRNSYNYQNSNYRQNNRSGYHQDQQMNRQPPPNGPPGGMYYPNAQQQQQQQNVQYGQHVQDNQAIYESNQPPYQGYDQGQRGAQMYQQQPMEPTPPGYEDGHGSFPIHGPNDGLPSYGGAGLLGSGYDAQVASMEQQNAMYRGQPSVYPQQQQPYPQNPAMYAGQYVQGQYPPNVAQYRQGMPQGMGMVPNQNQMGQGYYPMPGQMVPHMMQQPQVYMNVPVGIVCKAGPAPNAPESEKSAGQSSGKPQQPRKEGNQQGPSEKSPEIGTEQRNQPQPQQQPPQPQSGNPQMQQQQPQQHMQMQYDPTSQAQGYVPNPFHRAYDQSRVAPHQMPAAMPYNYAQAPQQQPQQPMPEHMNPIQMQNDFQQYHGQYVQQVPAMMQPQMGIPPAMGHPQNQMPYSPNAHQQQFYGRQRPEPLMNMQQGGQYMHPSMANQRPFNNAPVPGMSNQNAYPRGRGRGGRGGGGTWRGGNPDGRGDSSFTHSRQSSGQSYEGSRSQYGGNQNYYGNRGNQNDQSHNQDVSHNPDDEIEGLTNKIELLQPVRGSRNTSPSKQVLKLIDEKNQDDDLAVATSGEVEFVIENQSVIVGTQVSVENARRATPPTKPEIPQGSEEETDVDKLDPAATPMKCIRCANHADIPLTVVYSHNLRYPDGNTWCPKLQQVTCSECGATGDKAHDSQCCPVRNKNNPSSSSVTRNEEDYYSRVDSSAERTESNERERGHNRDRGGDQDRQREHDRERDRDFDHERSRDYSSRRGSSMNRSYDGGRGGRTGGGGGHNTGGSHGGQNTGGSSYRGGPKYRGQPRGGPRGGGGGGGGGSRGYDNRKH